MKSKNDLYDCKLESYKNKHNRDKALSEISEVVSATGKINIKSATQPVAKANASKQSLSPFGASKLHKMTQFILSFTVTVLKFSHFAFVCLEH